MKGHADTVQAAHRTGAVVRHKVERTVGLLFLPVLVVSLQKQFVVVVVIAVVRCKVPDKIYVYLFEVQFQKTNL